MNREIKFRAWDKETKEMSYDFLGKNWLKVYIESPYIELMQYTGLKDRNGKEIYEGDIISIPEMGRYEVVFKEGCFGAEDGQGFSPFRQSIWGLGCEVIGNIFENPELISNV